MLVLRNSNFQEESDINPYTNTLLSKFIGVCSKHAMAKLQNGCLKGLPVQLLRANYSEVSDI